MDDGIGLAEKLLGLDGFRVLEVTEGPDELIIAIETTADFVGCSACGVRAEAHDRMPIAIRDLACFGRPARLVWVKRRWRCRQALCEAKTWTEQSTHVDAQVVLTRRVGAEACRQVGELARPLSIYLAEDPAEAAVLVDEAILACAGDDVPEIVSLGHTLARWRVEILAHHDTGASNGPTEG